MVKSPVFIMSGSEDWIVPEDWIRQGYDALETETCWYKAIGIGHMNSYALGGSTAIAFFRCKLLGDE
ncbi:MAG: hypothetical protein HQK54_16450, partial [Oligoflexales bacterium]|nr:hypothetical protein [Oligoflexales bacterium]